MPINNQTVGRDVTLDIRTSRGLLDIPATAITQFDTKPTTTSTKSKGFDGVSRNAVFPDGWEGTISIDKMGDVVDAFWAQIEADFYNGVNTTGGTITETIANPDGSISQYRYIGVVFDLKDVGSKIADKLVQQKLNFMASRRLKVS